MNKLSDCITNKHNCQISKMLCNNESKVSTSIRDRFLLKNALVDYNGNYQYVKYGHDAIIWNDLGYVAEYLKTEPLSDNYAVTESIYNQSANSLSKQINYKYH